MNLRFDGGLKTPAYRRWLPFEVFASGEEGRLRTGTLNVLRWMSLAGQAVTVFFVHFGLGFDLPLFWCLAVIAIGVAFTAGLSVMGTPQRRPSDTEAGLYLAVDQTLLAALLFLTGGLENPFTLLFLAVLAVAASSLNLRVALGLGGYTLGLITLLALTHLPLPWTPGETLRLPLLYIAGVWIALVLGLGFTIIVTFRVASESTRTAAAYAALELALAREQKLAALGSLAAAAAHELGSPLGTIAVIAKEMSRQFPESSPAGEDLKLLRSQVDRCRDILGRLAHHPAQDDFGPQAEAPLAAFLEEIAAPYQGGPVVIDIAATGAAPLTVRRIPELQYAIGNLIENAADFARARVRVSASWDQTHLVLAIQDDGPGFAPDVISRLGEPYVTTRPGRGALSEEDLAPAQPDAGGHEGMGLGFFISKTLLERTGAMMHFGNADEGGALVTLVWPRGRIEAAQA